jgi:putative ATPase
MEVRRTGALSIPLHLRNAPTELMKREGYGAGYKYAHTQKGARARQVHLPTELLGRKFYEPQDSGYEKQLKLRLSELNPDFEAK